MKPTDKKSLGARSTPQPLKQQAGHAPQIKSAVAQPKTAVSAQSVKQPVAPPAYRPQQVPKVLQTKSALAQIPQAGQAPRQPAAPPVYRPQADRVNGRPSLPVQMKPKRVAPPVPHPQPGRQQMESSLGTNSANVRVQSEVRPSSGRARAAVQPHQAHTRTMSRPVQSSKSIQPSMRVTGRPYRGDVVQRVKSIGQVVPGQITAPQTRLLMYVSYLRQYVLSLGEAMPPYMASDLDYRLKTIRDNIQTMQVTSSSVLEVHGEISSVVEVIDMYDPTQESYISSYSLSKAISSSSPESSSVLPGFKSLKQDMSDGLYMVEVKPTQKIRMKTGEAPFENYSGGTSVAVAVEEAIVGLSLDGDTRTQICRHDYQPSASDYNLQVQLGGSRKYRVGKGDTSSTNVVITQEAWDKMIKLDRERWKQVIQEAHRYSFSNYSVVKISL